MNHFKIEQGLLNSMHVRKTSKLLYFHELLKKYIARKKNVCSREVCFRDEPKHICTLFKTGKWAFRAYCAVSEIMDVRCHWLGALLCTTALSRLGYSSVKQDMEIYLAQVFLRPTT